VEAPWGQNELHLGRFQPGKGTGQFWIKPWERPLPLSVLWCCSPWCWVSPSSSLGGGQFRRACAGIRLAAVVGLYRAEVAALIWKEYALQSVLGIALGLPFGYLIALVFIQSTSTDMYTFLVIIYPRTYLLSAVGALGFVAVALWFFGARCAAAGSGGGTEKQGLGALITAVI
jgi:hypothetical protein